MKTDGSNRLPSWYSSDYSRTQSVKGAGLTVTHESSSSSSCASAPIMYEIDVDDKIDGSRVRTAVLHVSTRVTSKSRIPVFEYPMRLAESRS